MRVRHHPSVDSAMSRYWRLTDSFDLCDDFGNVVLVLSGEQMIHWIQSHAAQAQIALDMAQAMARTDRTMYPRRRLLGQHKPLRGLDP